MDHDKILALAQSPDISSVLLAFELNNNFNLVEKINDIDLLMSKWAQKTIQINVNTNRIIVKEDKVEITQKEVNETREALLVLNKSFLQYEFMEEFVKKRYGMNIVFSFI